MKGTNLPGDAQGQSAYRKMYVESDGVPQEILTVSCGMCPGDAILVTKWIALEGTSRVARAHFSQLCGRFPRCMMEEAANFDRYLSVAPELAVACENGAHALYAVSEGGIFGALWNLAASAQTGLTVDLRKLPIRQETVEICNFYDLNPYQMLSGGSLLIAAEDGARMLAVLHENGILAAVVGKATAGNDRVVLNGDGRRFLGKPQRDEIYKILHI